jgi:hypothetical protein
LTVPALSSGENGLGFDGHGLRFGPAVISNVDVEVTESLGLGTK